MPIFYHMDYCQRDQSSSSEKFYYVVKINAVKSPLYIETNNISDSCKNEGGGGGGGGEKHSYVVVGDYLLWSDVENLCNVDMIFPARMISGRNILSFLDVHSVLADGFDLVYYQFMSCNFFCRIIGAYATLS
ncbi:hypothetical protein TEA_004061 [Camellia sinensis var. sinensis]|uniref:Uncharacterized protein n=1 Tax=Camellia sinensis var. sinensis TaxID=542762 RepID=A0A4V3WK57_CAMSN|nr:hypothetical protein TEA_004061 [Camellia sinensis var. sinensis]